MVAKMYSEKIEYLSENDHVLHRPDMYVGSIKPETKYRWTLDENGNMVLKETTLIPAICKLFDEVITNSIDEAIKTNYKFGNTIWVEINDKTIAISDNGRGISSKKDVTTGLTGIELAFTKLRTGSNFRDDKSSIGKFGVGVALVNIFSKFFYVETVNDTGKKYKLTCTENNNHSILRSNKVKSKSRGTCVKYILDFKYFNMSQYTQEYYDYFRTRLVILSMLFPGISFKLNKKKVKITKFETFCRLINETNVTIKDKNVQIGIFPSENEFQHLSFINGVETSRGGDHVDQIMTEIVNGLRNGIQKRHKLNVKPADIKSCLMVVLTVDDIKNVRFDSQTKERVIGLTFNVKDYNFEKLIKGIMNNDDIIIPIIEAHRVKHTIKEKIEFRRNQKRILKSRIGKLIDATSNDREKCRLFITEGDSALGQLLHVRNAKYDAGYPLRGKILNVHGVKPKQVLENEELKNIMSITGLKIGVPAENLNYGKIVIVTDQDVDGHSIAALLLNFFMQYWPELIEQKIVCRYVSPIIIAKRGSVIKRYYSINNYHSEKDQLDGYKIKYNKGLGGLNTDEYHRMIHQPQEIYFNIDKNANDFLHMVFGKDSNKRKKWLQE